MSFADELPNSVYSKSFGAEAARYNQYRPGYPAEAIDWALAPLGTSTGRPARIVDLGAGTGKLTESLADRADEVIAVEPDEAMLEMLGSTLPTIDARVGAADSIPVDDASVDAVFAGQAFHWFPRPASEHELARVIRPGGVLALIWNFPDRNVEWVLKLYEATRGVANDISAFGWDPLDSPYFGAAEEQQFPGAHVLPGPEGVLGLIHTWSWVITRPIEEHATIDRDVRAIIDNYPELQGETVVLPLKTLAIRHVRL